MPTRAAISQLRGAVVCRGHVLRAAPGGSGQHSPASCAMAAPPAAAAGLSRELRCRW